MLPLPMTLSLADALESDGAGEVSAIVAIVGFFLSCLMVVALKEKWVETGSDDVDI